MADNQAKKEQKKKKAQAKQDKAARADMRRQNSNKGRSLEEMFVYVDEFGNLSSVPTDPSKRKEIDPSEISIQPGSRPEPTEEPDALRRGKIDYFSQAKSFGFIKDNESGERIFVHASELAGPVKEGDTVTFLRQQNQRGFFASQVEIIKS